MIAIAAGLVGALETAAASVGKKSGSGDGMGFAVAFEQVAAKDDETAAVRMGHPGRRGGSSRAGARDVEGATSIPGGKTTGVETKKAKGSGGSAVSATEVAVESSVANGGGENVAPVTDTVALAASLAAKGGAVIADVAATGSGAEGLAAAKQALGNAAPASGTAVGSATASQRVDSWRVPVEPSPMRVHASGDEPGVVATSTPGASDGKDSLESAQTLAVRVVAAKAEIKAVNEVGPEPEGQAAVPAEGVVDVRDARPTANAGTLAPLASKEIAERIPAGGVQTAGTKVGEVHEATVAPVARVDSAPMQPAGIAVVGRAKPFAAEPATVAAPALEYSAGPADARPQLEPQAGPAVEIAAPAAAVREAAAESLPVKAGAVPAVSAKPVASLPKAVTTETSSSNEAGARREAKTSKERVSGATAHGTTVIAAAVSVPVSKPVFAPVSTVEALAAPQAAVVPENRTPVVVSGVAEAAGVAAGSIRTPGSSARIAPATGSKDSSTNPVRDGGTPALLAADELPVARQGPTVGTQAEMQPTKTAASKEPPLTGDAFVTPHVAYVGGSVDVKTVSQPEGRAAGAVGSDEPSIVPSGLSETAPAASADAVANAGVAVAGVALVTQAPATAPSLPVLADSNRRTVGAVASGSIKVRKASTEPVSGGAAVAGRQAVAASNGDAVVKTIAAEHRGQSVETAMPVTVGAGSDSASTHGVLGVVQSAALPSHERTVEGHAAGVSGASVSGASVTGETSLGAGDSLVSPMAHTTLQATRTVLEVGVPGGTHGWLKIRAEIGEGGAVQASVSAASHAGQETLRRELPAINAFLHSEQVPVSVQMAHGLGSGLQGAKDGGFSLGSGLAQDANASGSGRGDAGPQGGLVGGDGAGSGRRQEGSGFAERSPTTNVAGRTAEASRETEWQGPVGYGTRVSTNGGSWLNVVA